MAHKDGRECPVGTKNHKQVPRDHLGPKEWVKSMGCTKTTNYRLSVFFNLSFIGDKWRAKNDKNAGFFQAFFPEKAV